MSGIERPLTCVDAGQRSVGEAVSSPGFATSDHEQRAQGPREGPDPHKRGGAGASAGRLLVANDSLTCQRRACAARRRCRVSAVPVVGTMRNRHVPLADAQAHDAASTPSCSAHMSAAENLGRFRPSSCSIAGRSRWSVGSTRTRRFTPRAWSSAIAARVRSPGESLPTRLVTWSVLRPNFASRVRTSAEPSAASPARRRTPAGGPRRARCEPGAEPGRSRRP